VPSHQKDPHRVRPAVRIAIVDSYTFVNLSFGLYQSLNQWPGHAGDVRGVEAVMSFPRVFPAADGRAIVITSGSLCLARLASGRSLHFRCREGGYTALRPVLGHPSWLLLACLRSLKHRER
jgi:hypothetical protein